MNATSFARLIAPAVPFFPVLASPSLVIMLTVTFLIPIFGILWGSIFLREVIGWNAIVGSCIVILGTALVTGFNPAMPMAREVSRNA